MNKKPLYIGVSGLARSGKNLFCDIAVAQLTKRNFKPQCYALANELKQECRDFVKEKLNLDVFSEKTEDKNLFRPLLVWYAGVKREQTKGRYWVELLERTINTNAHSDVIIISDVRFNQFKKDEVYWLKNELDGKLVHISKFTYGFPTNGRHVKVSNDKTKKIFIDPPNETEALNDPKVKKYADYKIEWEHVDDPDILNNPYLNSEVEKCLESILKS